MVNAIEDWTRRVGLRSSMGKLDFDISQPEYALLAGVDVYINMTTNCYGSPSSLDRYRQSDDDLQLRESSKR